MVEDTNLRLTAHVVAVFVAKNTVSPEALPAFIRSTYERIAGLSLAEALVVRQDDLLQPAVPIEDSIGDDHIICLEDGLKFKTLTRHLSAHYKLSPAAYRLRWGLPDDYPMVAPKFSQYRSALAKSHGLGRNGRQRKAQEAAK